VADRGVRQEGLDDRDFNVCILRNARAAGFGFKNPHPYFKAVNRLIARFKAHQSLVVERLFLDAELSDFWLMEMTGHQLESWWIKERSFGGPSSMMPDNCGGVVVQLLPPERSSPIQPKRGYNGFKCAESRSCERGYEGSN